jgi:hypothetical protein
MLNNYQLNMTTELNSRRPPSIAAVAQTAQVAPGAPKKAGRQKKQNKKIKKNMMHNVFFC